MKVDAVVIMRAENARLIAEGFREEQEQSRSGSPPYCRRDGVHRGNEDESRGEVK